MPGARQGGTGALRVRVLVVERPPLGAVVDPVGLDDEPAVGADALRAVGARAAAALGTGLAGVGLLGGSGLGSGGLGLFRFRGPVGAGGVVGGRRAVRRRDVVGLGAGRTNAGRGCVTHHTSNSGPMPYLNPGESAVDRPDRRGRTDRLSVGDSPVDRVAVRWF